MFVRETPRIFIVRTKRCCRMGNIFLVVLLQCSWTLFSLKQAYSTDKNGVSICSKLYLNKSDASIFAAPVGHHKPLISNKLVVNSSYLNIGSPTLSICILWTPASDGSAWSIRVVQNGVLGAMIAVPVTRGGHVVPWQRVWSVDEKAFFDATWSCTFNLIAYYFRVNFSLFYLILLLWLNDYSLNINN